MNVCIFTGRLARDCETRLLEGNKAMCTFTLAVDYGFGDNKGTNWISCSLFGKRAEGQLPDYLLKGTQINVQGELRVRNYDDKEGVRRTSVEMIVNGLDLLSNTQSTDTKL